MDAIALTIYIYLITITYLSILYKKNIITITYLSIFLKKKTSFKILNSTCIGNLTVLIYVFYHKVIIKYIYLFEMHTYPLIKELDSEFMTKFIKFWNANNNFGS